MLEAVVLSVHIVSHQILLSIGSRLKSVTSQTSLTQHQKHKGPGTARDLFSDILIRPPLLRDTEALLIWCDIPSIATKVNPAPAFVSDSSVPSARMR